jgi:hypothetical protein
MPNYQDGKIYKIIDLTNDNVYIGSTCEPTLARRLAKHVGNYKRYKKGDGHYITSFKIIENGNYDIQLIESYPCSTRDELHSREGHYIKTLACVNKVIAGRTKKEYRVDNQHKIQKALSLKFRRLGDLKKSYYYLNVYYMMKRRMIMNEKQEILDSMNDEAITNTFYDMLKLKHDMKQRNIKRKDMGFLF